MTYTIAIANEKGGVAKTTTTLSLGGAFVENGARVLLVDMDAQANLTLALGSEPGNASKTIVNVLLEKLSINSIAIETGIPGLFLAPANNEITVAERQLPTHPGYEVTLRDILNREELPYDYVILDCPPHLGAITLNALNAANLLIMPTQAEYFSIYALRDMMGLIRRVRAQNNPHLTYRLLLTMFDRRNRIHRTLSEQLRTTFGNGVFQNIIEVDTKLRESQIAGMPIIYHSPKSRSAEQYRALAQEILAYVKETATEPA
jgi:chromosome partitioning protein